MIKFEALKKFKKKYKKYNKFFLRNFLVFKSGSALILTMFILAGMFLVAISSSYVVTLGIKAGGIQAQSTRAYFIAETGMEYFLWELRINPEYDYFYDLYEVPIFEGDLGADGVTGVSRKFEVIRKDITRYQSIGEFGSTKRAVEIEF